MPADNYHSSPGQMALRRLVERLTVPAVYVAGERLFLNTQAEHILGYSTVEVGTLELWFQRLYPGRGDRFRLDHEENRSTLAPQPRAVFVTHRSGEERLIEFTVCRDELDGEIWLLRDLSESDRMSRLMAQTARLTLVGGWEVDVPSMRLYWTEETYRIHDLTPDEYIPTVETAIAFYSPESVPIITDAVRLGIERGDPFDLELVLITARKKRIHVRSVGLAVREQERTTKLYGAFQDISARKAAERERQEFERNLQQTQRLESLGVLSGGIAHDFNNLLTGILGNADLIRCQTPAGAPTLEFLAQLERSAERAADLCRQMLAYAGKARMVVGPCSLSNLVEDTARLVHYSVSRKATVTMRLDSTLPAIQGDVSQLRQVIMNLVINASEALGDREGLIAITTGEEDVQDADLSRGAALVPLPPGHYVFLEVSDTGCGMDEATRQRIFEPFFTTKFTGRGLGLSAVLGIVRQHGGGVQLTSKPGHGSTFRLYFPPYHDTVLPEAVRTPEQPTSFRGGTVLVVEDEEEVRLAAVGLLRSLGLSVRTAENGIQALEVIATHGKELSLVLLDLTMPRLDGAETLREIRRRAPHLPVIVMSGYSERELDGRLAGERPDGFLQKPFARDSLRSSVQAVLGR